MGFFSVFKEDKESVGKGNKTPEPEIDININVGTSGAKSASRDLSLKYDYEKIRSEVDMSMIKRMLRVLDNVETKTQFFTQLEDDGIPLVNLIALGITSEEAISSYRTLRARGLDTYKADVSKTQRVDDEYANEVQTHTEEYPGLRLIDGVDLDEPMSPEQLYKSEVKARIALETQLRDAERKIKRLEEAPEPEPSYKDTVQQEIIDIDDMFEDVEDEASEEELSDEEYHGWASKFDKVKDTILKTKELDDQQEKLEETGSIQEEVIVGDGKYQAVKSVHKLKEKERQDKEIFVLSEPFEVSGELKGYKVVFIQEPNDLVLFTASKDNLLVITRAIPLQLVEMFIEWIGSVASKGVKIRAVTLNGMEIEHAFIEGVIDLTQESLDEYYERNKLSKYIGTGVDTFFDIGQSIEDIVGKDED